MVSSFLFFVVRLLLLLEQILEDEVAPSAAACVHQRATLVELSQLDGCEPELFGQIRHGSGRVLVVARQKDDPGWPPSTIGSVARMAATRWLKPFTSLAPVNAFAT